MGVVASHLNIEPSTTILDLLRDDGPADKINAKRALIRVAENFEILAGPHEIVAPIASSPADVARVVGLLKHLADVVVLDVPCTYDDLYFDTLAAADQVLLIGEQKLPSIRALKMVREAMVRNGGSPRLVLNRFDPRNKPFAVDRLLRPLGVSRVRTVARDDAGVNSAVEAACTLRLGAPRSPALADILAIVEEIVAVDAPPRVKAEGIFSRIGRAFSNS
jgi:Flp pilus assembly CpaE family ATPase